MTQKSYISKLCNDNPDAVIIGSIGTISYDLKEIEHPHKILVKGAMGSVLGIGLGYALNSKKEVIVVIGDGSFLMKMGSWATLLKYKPENLHIIVIDNECYASCGGQATNFYQVKGLVDMFFEVFTPEDPLAPTI
jgi:thiamine pyrophosphate-dependent acetolactate synthase large subunit-like protein